LKTILIKSLGFLSLVALAYLPFMSTAAQAQDERVFELRTYKATPGNLDALVARFRDHTMRIFEKHGMTNIAYWLPTDEPDSADTLVYVISHASREAANNSWRAFSQDPEWQKVNEESNVNGPILLSVERRYMKAVDFSPMK
jgi:hypothetical protein